MWSGPKHWDLNLLTIIYSEKVSIELQGDFNENFKIRPRTFR